MKHLHTSALLAVAGVSALANTAPAQNFTCYFDATNITLGAPTQGACGAIATTANSVDIGYLANPQIVTGGGTNNTASGAYALHWRYPRLEQHRHGIQGFIWGLARRGEYGNWSIRTLCRPRRWEFCLRLFCIEGQPGQSKFRDGSGRAAI